LNRLLAQARQITTTTASVLITGPSGSGKEVLARAIHQASGLDGPFVAINTGAVPLELLKSELFGHERGSFTGASSQRTGLITEADRGSLFLDEIGDMPAALQVKLLRVLQEGEVLPVGSNHHIAVKARVISATHRDLQQQIECGAFREDLFYQLGVVELAIPPLAARATDIPLLANHFLNRVGATSDPRKSLAPRAIESLLRASWPGNIRQLANVIKRAHALCRPRDRSAAHRRCAWWEYRASWILQRCKE
jgi:two-component system, NtrC family, response regulator GlrR